MSNNVVMHGQSMFGGGVWDTMKSWGRKANDFLKTSKIASSAASLIPVYGGIASKVIGNVGYGGPAKKAKRKVGKGKAKKTKKVK